MRNASSTPAHLAGWLNFCACKGAHTLFTGQRERERERERESGKDRQKERKRERERGKDREGKIERER